MLPPPRLTTLCLTSLTLACGSAADPTPYPSAPADVLDTLVIATTDYRTGAISVADIAQMTTSDPLELTHSDAVLRSWGERAIVINRYGGDNLQLLNRASGFDTELQFSVGNGTNPHDVAIDPQGRALVTLYDAPHLGIFDPLTGEALGQLDLTPYADSDGIPEADAITIIGDRAFISLQRLNRKAGWVVEGESQVAILDLNTDTFIDANPELEGLQAIPLPFSSPTDRLLPLPSGDLLIVTTGLYTTTGDGALLRLASEPPFEVDVLITEDALGGTANYLASTDGARVFLVVNIPKEEGQYEADTALFVVDTTLGTHRELMRTQGYALTDIAIDSKGRLLVADRTSTAPGCWVLDSLSLEPVGTGFIPMPLPPFSIGVFGSPSETLP